MNNIKAVYTDYKELLEIFGDDVIRDRIQHFIDLFNSFKKRLGDDYASKIDINDKVLQHCVMDYFSDIHRLKDYHEVEKVNTIKRVAYESAWFLRRKPIQVLSDETDDDALVYINEKFILSYLLHEALNGRENDILSDKSLISYKSFVNSLFYHLKYRNCDAKVLELMLLAFKAGVSYNTKLPITSACEYVEDNTDPASKDTLY